MAFEDSLSKVVKKHEEILATLESNLNLAGLNVAKSAAKMSIDMMSTILNSNELKDTFKKMASQGNAAGKTFFDEFRKGATTSMGALHDLKGMMNDLDSRTNKLAERQTRGWSKAAKVQREVAKAHMEAGKQIALNSTAYDNLGKEIKAIEALKQKAIKHNQGLAANDPARIRLHPFNQKIKRLESHQNNLNDSSTEIQKTIDNSKMLGSQTRAVEIEEWMQGKREKAFGGLYKAQDKVGFAKDVTKAAIEKPAMIVSAVVMSIVAVMKIWADQAIESGKVFRGAGQIAGQMGKSMSLAGDVAADLFSQHHMLASAEESAQAVSALQDALGSLAVPRGLAADVLFMNKAFNVSMETASSFATTFKRFAGDTAAQKAMKYAGDFANANGLNANRLIGDMASHAEDFAQAGNMSAKAFTKAAADAQRIGYSMSSMTGLANRLVSNFEGALQTQAELATMFPGMDMTETMYASQFGTNEDVANSVKSMIQGSGQDFSKMPNSFKQSLMKNTGLSATDLMNITGSKNMSDFVDPSTAQQIDLMQTTKTQMFDTAANGFPGVIAVLKDILFMISPQRWVQSWASTAANAVAHPADMAGGLTTGGFAGAAAALNANVHHDGGMAGFGTQRSVNPNVFVGAPRFHGGLLPDEIPAILQRGEAVLTGNMLDNLGQLLSGAQSLAGTAQTMPTSGTSEVEKLLRTLIAEVRRGHVIELDGKKVGKSITDSYSRSN